MDLLGRAYGQYGLCILYSSINGKNTDNYHTEDMEDDSYEMLQKGARMADHPVMIGKSISNLGAYFVLQTGGEEDVKEKINHAVEVWEEGIELLKSYITDEKDEDDNETAIDVENKYIELMLANLHSNIAEVYLLNYDNPIKLANQIKVEQSR